MPPRTPPRDVDPPRGRDYTTVANGLIVGGALAVVGGGVWIAITVFSGRAPGRERAALTVAPQVDGSAPGVTVEGVF